MNQRRPNSDERKARRATMSRRTFVGVATAATLLSGSSSGAMVAPTAPTPQHSAANGATLFSRFSTLPAKALRQRAGCCATRKSTRTGGCLNMHRTPCPRFGAGMCTERPILNWDSVTMTNGSMRPTMARISATRWFITPVSSPDSEVGAKAHQWAAQLVASQGLGIGEETGVMNQRVAEIRAIVGRIEPFVMVTGIPV